MPDDDPDQPPKHALPLRDALEQAMDWWDARESRRLARALAEEAANPPDPTNPAAEYFRPSPFRRPADSEEALYSLIAFGAAEAWGQPGWPKNKEWVAISQPLWQRQRSSIDDAELGLVTFEMPDGTTSFWHVLVALVPGGPGSSGRGRPEEPDAPALGELHRRLAADPTLKRHPAALRLIDEGWPVSGGGTRESKAKRLVAKLD